MIISAPKSRKSWWRTVGHLLVKAWRSVALLEDTPRRIAIGSAIGTFFAFQPIVIGGQMAWGALATKLARGNVFASLPWAWITNPFTVAPIYYGCYRFGRLIAPVGSDVGYDEIAALGTSIVNLSLIESFKRTWELLVDIIVPLQLGCVIIGVLVGAGIYVGVFRATAWLQRRRFLRRAQWLGALARKRAAEPPATEGVHQT
ncbi:MAG TPA: DUF2062 domain-containing protein [Planctomycetota bacterium]|nr:DUF2062 domain-containing protein [Planctomycetota bacterium]